MFGIRKKIYIYRFFVSPIIVLNLFSSALVIANENHQNRKIETLRSSYYIHAVPRLRRLSNFPLLLQLPNFPRQHCRRFASRACARWQVRYLGALRWRLRLRTTGTITGRPPITISEATERKRGRAWKRGDLIISTTAAISLSLSLSLSLSRARSMISSLVMMIRRRGATLSRFACATLASGERIYI